MCGETSMCVKKDWTGVRLEHAVVVEKARSSGGKAVWLCRCDCGSNYLAYSHDLAQGKAQSCGCAKLVVAKTPLQRLRSIYGSMKQRCYNPNSPAYVNYGGRGIFICEEWLNDPQSFIDWSLAHGYTEWLTIDRIDVNGPYSPENCRWATMKVQGSNTRKTVRIEYEGKKLSLREWSVEKHIPLEVLRVRYNRFKNNPEKILAPYKPRSKQR